MVQLAPHPQDRVIAPPLDSFSLAQGSVSVFAHAADVDPKSGAPLSASHIKISNTTG